MFGPSPPGELNDACGLIFHFRESPKAPRCSLVVKSNSNSTDGELGLVDRSAFTVSRAVGADNERAHMQDERRASLAKRFKYVSMAICVQAACLGVGLWMQHQFLYSSTRESAFEQAWSELSGEAVLLVQELRNAPDSHNDGSGDSLVSAAGSVSPLAHRLGFALIVDADWQVIEDGWANAVKPTGTSIGDRISWNQAGGTKDAVAMASRGLVTIAGNQYVASAVPLGHGGDTVVTFRLVASIEELADALLASLPVISGLTFVWTCASLSIFVYMVFCRFHDEAERTRAQSVAEGLRQRRDLVRTRDAVVFGLAKLADSRDPETGDHLDRLSVYATMLASALRHHPKYGRQVTPAFVRLIAVSSVLHDIGKVGIEDRILLKQGLLTPDERRVIETHAVIGGDCLRGIERRLGSSNFLQMAREIAFAHHEKWDGTGYPHGLAGEEIPLSARIVAVADVYDALSSRRVYKEAQSHEESEAILRNASGTHFDPDLIEAWLPIAPKFAEVALRYSSARRDEVSGDDRKSDHTTQPPAHDDADSGQGSTVPEAGLATGAPVGVGIVGRAFHGGGDLHEPGASAGEEDQEL